jgi:hypothetical protein
MNVAGAPGRGQLTGRLALAVLRGLSNNGTASGDSRLKTAGLPPLAVRMWVGP